MKQLVCGMRRGILWIAFACVIVSAQQSAWSQVAAPGDSAAVHREKIEWCDIWIADGERTKAPRVLLIGDSITRAYYPAVAAAIGSQASVSRLSTSKSVGDPVLLDEIALVLKQYKFDVIQFNNGMHGWDYTEDDYRHGFPALVTTIRRYEPNATLIWATTTPVRVAHSLDQVSPRTERVKARNHIAADYLAGRNVLTDDLYSVMDGHPDYYKPDGVHPNDKGVAAESAQVAATILKQLPASQKQPR